MLNLILVLGVIYFSVSLILSIAFIYLPVNNIEKNIETAIPKFENVDDRIKETQGKIETILDAYKPEVTDIFDKIEIIVKNICTSNTTLGKFLCSKI